MGKRRGQKLRMKCFLSLKKRKKKKKKMFSEGPLNEKVK